MAQAASALKAQPAAPLKHPNLFQAQGDGIHIGYATSGFDGKPHFSYQDAVQSLQFTGDQINTIETELGALVTVFIRRTIDAGSTTFTLLVPRVNLRFGDFAPITTLGITAIHQFSIIGPPNGQADFYHSHVLVGDAALVVF
jgi:hypothetical protein